MNKLRLLGAVFAVPFTFITVSVNAALVSALGGQAVYDTDRDISWVADANLAATNTFGLSTGVSLGTYPGDSSGVSGIINANGTMNWPGALFWIDAMNTANYLGFNDWRLPSTLVPDNGCTDFDGTLRTDSRGWDCTGSEMGHLFYDEFGATRLTSVLTTGTPTELAKFSNVQSAHYWSGSELSSSNAWDFNFLSGFQRNFSVKNVSNFAWAVRSGDVTAGDSDSDGIVDLEDNCIEVPNGLVLPDAGSNSQLDTDSDGYGNMCDGDLNNDGDTNTLDLNLYKLAHRTSPGDTNYNADADFNGDVVINTLDLNIYKGLHRKPPGPSCCAP